MAAATTADSDFASFLELGDFDGAEFPIYDLQHQHGGTSQPNGQQLTEAAEPHGMQQHMPQQGMVMQHPHVEDGLQHAQHHQQQQQPGHPMGENGTDVFDFHNHAHYQQQQQQHHQPHPPYSLPQDPAFQPHAVVPPTPNSIDMHSDRIPAQFLHQMDPQQRAILEQRYHLTDDQVMSFTPLVSPAVTPHDTRYKMPQDFTVPGAYFSPLASPALEAQHGGSRAYHHYQQHNGNSATTSPVDADIDMLGESATSQPQGEPARRLKNKRSTPRNSMSNPQLRVRQSPIVKPAGGRRKTNLSSTIPPKEVNALLEEVEKHKLNSPTQAQSIGFPKGSGESSETDSVSPEPLSESIMGPPPRPKSSTASPSIAAKNARAPGPTSDAAGIHPATPASLMRLQASPNVDASPTGGVSLEGQSMDHFALPEPAAGRPTLAKLDTTPTDEHATPRMNPRKTPKLGPLSTPSAGAVSSALTSPALSAIASPTGSTAPRRPDSKGAGRGSKKRNNTGSQLVSPALRPKISPSIKPLLPEGALSDEAHTLLLAAKSNYQNILEGTHVPGVSYPEALSTNLTSKRTSHKIAEQGRRNRINTALHEMQSLLPSKSGIKAESGESKSPEGPIQQSNSKAATVESAIEYIKVLKEEASQRDQQLHQHESEIEMLRKKMSDLQKRLGDASPAPLSTNGSEPISEKDDTAGVSS